MPTLMELFRNNLAQQREARAGIKSPVAKGVIVPASDIPEKTTEVDTHSDRYNKVHEGLAVAKGRMLAKGLERERNAMYPKGHREAFEGDFPSYW